MKFDFNIEIYEYMIGLDLTARDYLDFRMNIHITDKGEKFELCTSTFNSAILLGILEGLIDIYEGKGNSFTVEMFESNYELHFSYNAHYLKVQRYEASDEEIEIQLSYKLDDFVEAFVKESKKFAQYILKMDEDAFEFEYYKVFNDDINVLNNHLQNLI